MRPFLNSWSMNFRCLSRSDFPKVNCLLTEYFYLKNKNSSESRSYDPGEKYCLTQLFQLAFIRHAQFLAAFPASCSQHLASVRSFHAFTKTVYCFPALPVRLKCTFHCYDFCPVFEYARGETGCFSNTRMAPSHPCRERDGKGKENTPTPLKAGDFFDSFQVFTLPGFHHRQLPSSPGLVGYVSNSPLLRKKYWRAGQSLPLNL